MPVTFKNALPKATTPHGGSFEELREKVRADFNLPATAEIALGATATVVRHGKVSLTLPIGVGAIKAKGSNYNEAVVSTANLMSKSLKLNKVGIEPEAATTDWDELEDEQWMMAVSEKLFPGAVHLSKADAMHQLVTGTSGGSLYRAAFIGPELRGAVRVKGSKLSFRFTTKDAKCPPDEVLAILNRLGVTSVYEDRVTTHCSMSGPYDGNEGEYRMVFGAFYAALRPWCTSKFPSIKKLMEGVK